VGKGRNYLHRWSGNRVNKKMPQAWLLAA